MHGHFQIARLQLFHAAFEYDAAAVDEHEVGEDVLDLFHLMCRHYDGAAAIKVVVQQGIVELLAIQDVQTQRRLVQHQQSRVNRHDKSEVQFGHHPLRQFPHLAAAPDGGLRQKTFRLGTIESRMHAGDLVECLRDPDPARQHGTGRHEADIAPELIALVPGVASEHFQFSLIRREAENCIERRGLAGAVRTDESQDAALFNAQIDAVESDRCSERLTETASFYACHGFSAPPLTDPASRASMAQPSRTAPSHSVALPLSGQVAGWWPGSSATLRPGISVARPAAT